MGHSSLPSVLRSPLVATAASTAGKADGRIAAIDILNRESMSHRNTTVTELVVH